MMAEGECQVPSWCVQSYRINHSMIDESSQSFDVYMEKLAI